MYALATLSDMPRKPSPQHDKRLPLAAKVQPELLNGLRDLANRDERTLSFMVERAIREYLERHGDKSKKN